MLPAFSVMVSPAIDNLPMAATAAEHGIAPVNVPDSVSGHGTGGNQHSISPVSPQSLPDAYSWANDPSGLKTWQLELVDHCQKISEQLHQIRSGLAPSESSLTRLKIADN
ncbi:MAG: hypothetical protein KDA89_18975 [Planctomycetaceae bacterium]|nr:hypothetical protein [Planctomycetaceae bacterium]